MAPTEILARQHLKTIVPLAEAAGIRVAVLTGRERGSERKTMLDRLALGDIDIVVGTHALFQEDVVFHDLALAIVDEQHRFGVHQRLALAQKGEAVDMLVLTATPIPRTLVLTYFGDMDISELREKPAGRQPIDTRTIPLVAPRRGGGRGRPRHCRRQPRLLGLPAGRGIREDRFGRGRRALRGIAQALWQQGRPGARPHEGAEKDAAMARFSAGETQLLVATTVIEVGVDVPEATVMVIEHAERFGLAQMHQLRGRVGRGTGKSTCLLLYKAPLGETAKARLAILRETEDGFRIAEEDLRLRGEGDVLGTRQSGLPGFRIARAEVHGKYLGAARDDAALTLSRDPSLAERARRGAAPPALSVRKGRGDPADQGGLADCIEPPALVGAAIPFVGDDRRAERRIGALHVEHQTLVDVIDGNEPRARVIAGDDLVLAAASRRITVDRIDHDDQPQLRGEITDPARRDVHEIERVRQQQRIKLPRRAVRVVDVDGDATAVRTAWRVLGCDAKQEPVAKPGFDTNQLIRPYHPPH